MGYRLFVQKEVYFIHPSIPCFVLQLIVYHNNPTKLGEGKNMDCVAIETLRTQILRTLLRE
jgi:hypothetical protein